MTMKLLRIDVEDVADERIFGEYFYGCFSTSIKIIRILAIRQYAIYLLRGIGEASAKATLLAICNQDAQSFVIKENHSSYPTKQC